MSTHRLPDAAPPDPPGYEARDANLTTIVFVGCVLVASAVVIHVAVWGLFRYFSERDNRTKTSDLPLVRAEMNRLPARPRLEAFEPAHAGVVLRTDDGEEQFFYVDANNLTVQRVPRQGKRSPLGLYALRPGTEVALTYARPQGLTGGDGAPPGEDQVTRYRAVRIETGPGRAGAGPADESGLITVTGRLVRIDPTSGPDMREAAEARLGRYGWVDEKKQVAHIPIDEAMKILVKDRLLKSEPVPEEGKARQENPESSSGRQPDGGKK